MDDDESRIAEKFEALRGVMDEQIRRLWAATEARVLAYGGVSVVARAVGLTRPTITARMKEWAMQDNAGRPRLTDTDAGCARRWRS